jgi:2-amino-4-hydroxy-6-hydroxymethyldihydropteridine diphosphokinase
MQQNSIYVIALGSNQRHSLLGGPASILIHAISALETDEINVFAQSRIIASQPVGPSQRLFANGAVLVETNLDPAALLSRLKQIETHFGRRTGGGRWRARVLDLDIILWSGGIWTSDNPALSIPHPCWLSRPFVVQPIAEIAPQMRDPISGYTVMQLLSRMKRSKRVDHNSPRL